MTAERAPSGPHHSAGAVAARPVPDTATKERPALTWNGVAGLFAEAATRWAHDRCDRLAAALSYYALFSLFPLALLAVTALGFVLGDDPGVRARIVGSLDVTESPALLALLDDTLASMQQHQTARGIGTIVGVAALLLSASGVFSELQSAFNLVWRVPDARVSGVWATVRDAAKGKFFAFLLVLLAALALLASLVASTGVSAAQKLSPGALGGSWFWVPIDLATSTLFLTGILAGMFRLLPRTHVAWRDVLVGALFTSVVFALLKKLLGYYLAHLGSYAAYGVVGALLGFLTWIYVTSMLLYFGVELTRVYAERFGSACDLA